MRTVESPQERKWLHSGSFFCLPCELTQIRMGACNRCALCKRLPDAGAGHRAGRRLRRRRRSAGRIPCGGPDSGAVVTIRVLLADDQALVRAGFRGLLRRAKDIEVVGEAAGGDEAVRQARALRPDVVLMDIRMPGMDGLAATRQISGECRVVTWRGRSPSSACATGCSWSSSPSRPGWWRAPQKTHKGCKT
jgi:hypothetical protein